MVDNGDDMRVSAKADYAARAAAELAAAPDAPVTADRIADAQDIPVKFLETILLELKHAGIVRSQRGPDGGYTLARPAEDISLADVIRAVDGPLANVRGDRPENMEYRGAAAPLTDVWIAVRAALREILEATSLASLRDGRLPPRVRELADIPEAWVSLGRIRGAAGAAAGGSAPAGSTSAGGSSAGGGGAAGQLPERRQPKVNSARS
jgi:Rrf2 family protein